MVKIYKKSKKNCEENGGIHQIKYSVIAPDVYLTKTYIVT